MSHKVEVLEQPMRVEVADPTTVVVGGFDPRTATDHIAGTTNVHGIPNTAVLVTQAELAAHEADTTAIHGITDTAQLVTLNTAQTITGLKTISPSSASAVGLIVKAVFQQTGDLQQWQDNNGVNLARVLSAGEMYLSGTTAPASGTRLFVTPVSAGTSALIVQGVASQTANIQEWRNSAGTVLARMESDGRLLTQGLHNGSATSFVLRLGASPNSMLVADNAANTPLWIKGAASQTADLQQWQDSAGTVLANILPSGIIRFRGDPLVTSVQARLGATGDNVHALAILGYFSASGCMTIENNNNGGNGVLGNGPLGSINRLQVILGGSTALTGSPANTTSVGIIVKGLASQTAALQQWQDSTGLVMAALSSSGNFVVGATTPSTRLHVVGAAAGAQASLFVAGHASQTPMQVRGFASQTANLQEWQNSSGTTLMAVNASGQLHDPAVGSQFFSMSGSVPTLQGQSEIQLRAGSAGSIFIRPHASPTANTEVFRVRQFSTAASRFAVQDEGATRITLGRATDVGLIVQGAASQTADLQQWQNSAGTVLASVGSGGVLSNTNGFIGGTVRPATDDGYSVGTSTFRFSQAFFNTLYLGLTNSQVTFGAADSGGSGFKVLRVPN